MGWRFDTPYLISKRYGELHHPFTFTQKNFCSVNSVEAVLFGTCWILSFLGNYQMVVSKQKSFLFEKWIFIRHICRLKLIYIRIIWKPVLSIWTEMGFYSSVKFDAPFIFSEGMTKFCTLLAKSHKYIVYIFKIHPI